MQLVRRTHALSDSTIINLLSVLSVAAKGKIIRKKNLELSLFLNLVSMSLVLALQMLINISTIAEN